MARKKSTAPVVESYLHKEATAASRPEAGVQAQFRHDDKKQTYKYDSSLSPALDWDGQNHAREQGEALIHQILEAGNLAEAKAAAEKLKAMSRPFLNWAGKAERLSFDVPTLPLFVHERLSTKAIIESLRGHRREGRQKEFNFYGDPRHGIADQILKAYEYRDQWVNRLILGDNLQVMNSLLHKEKLGGQVQMIYLDPPYGIKFGSNFQPFVRKRDVSHGDDDDLTREPEMVQAYRDTWELGLHSYLTYLRDRLLVARELLHPTGSVFVQISDENLHHVREVMNEVFGAENYVSTIVVKKTGGLGSSGIKSVADYLLWSVKDCQQTKYRPLFALKELGKGESTGERYDQLLSPDGKTRRPMTAEERETPTLVPPKWRAYQLTSLISGAYRVNTTVPFEFQGEIFHPGDNACWKTTVEGLRKLVELGRIQKAGKTLRYVRFLDDFPCAEGTNIWDDVAGAANKLYTVQTSETVVQRCILMTSDPGDLILDPNCGGGTTACVAEHWGRRWITIDVSRVPLALARQRLLTATFPWYDLKHESRGPAGGFVYKRKQNRRGEEVGGIVPHVTLGSIANDEKPKEEVLVDRPEVVSDVVRVAGPFTVEAVMPVAVTPDVAPEVSIDDRSYLDRMIAIFRRSPRLALPGNRFISFERLRRAARAHCFHADAELVNGSIEPVAVLIGPERGPIGEKAVYDAAREARGSGYVHLVVIGFGVEAKARHLIDTCEAVCRIPATYAAATPDLTMGDLLKNMRSSQILSVCGMPDVELVRLPAKKGEPQRYQLKLLGLDVFHPITNDVDHRPGHDVPAWLLDDDYDDLVFRISQAFFPRTHAWDGLQRSLRGSFDDSLWRHLAGTESAPFEAGKNGQVAVKVIDDRGNELLVVKKLDEATDP